MSGKIVIEFYIASPALTRSYATEVKRALKAVEKQMLSHSFRERIARPRDEDTVDLFDARGEVIGNLTLFGGDDPAG